MKQYVSVRFDSTSNRYTYSAPASLKIQNGDMLVVKDPRGKAKLVQVMQTLKEKDVTYPLNQIKSIHALVTLV